jgi:hypothetical protein
MLPACRTEDEEFTIPHLELTPSDVDGFLHELQGFHEAFSDCFARREPREHFLRYLMGQFSKLERKSIEPMALKVTIEDVLVLVTWVQRRNHCAYLSHRQRRETEGCIK